MKRALVWGGALGVVVGWGTGAEAAAPKKQCINAAETGQQLRSSGRLIQARRALAACTASTCPTVVRRDCGRWIEEIDAAQPSVSVKLEDATGADVPDGKVLLDGEPMVRAADGRATPVDPGTHKLVWSRETGRSVEQEVVVREGERNRVIVLRVPSPGLVPRAGSETSEPSSPPSPAHARGPLPFIVGGLGLAVAGAGAVFWGIGLNDRSNLSTSCAAAHACAQSDVDASHTKLIVGDVLVGVGILAVATAVYLYVSDDGRSSTAASRPLLLRF
jgi:hypothetical protein